MDCEAAEQREDHSQRSIHFYLEKFAFRNPIFRKRLVDNTFTPCSVINNKCTLDLEITRHTGCFELTYTLIRMCRRFTDLHQPWHEGVC